MFCLSVFNEWQVLPRAAETARMLGLDVLWAPGSLHAKEPISPWPLTCWSQWISCLVHFMSFLLQHTWRLGLIVVVGKGCSQPWIYQGVSTQVECPVQRISIPRGGIVAWMQGRLLFWGLKHERECRFGWRCWRLSHSCTSEVWAWSCVISDQKKCRFYFFRCWKRDPLQLSINQNLRFSISLYQDQNQSWVKQRRKHQPAMCSLRLTRAAHHDQMLLLSPSRAQASFHVG